MLRDPRSDVRLGAAAAALKRLLGWPADLTGQQMLAILTVRPEWIEASPPPSQLSRTGESILWLPPMGGKISLVQGTSGFVGPHPSPLAPTLTAEEQVLNVQELNRSHDVGTAYVHQFTVQGRLPDEFKYVAVALITASAYANNWAYPFFTAPWGTVAPMVHDGGNVRVELNPLWQHVGGRTDFLQRVVVLESPTVDGVGASSLEGTRFKERAEFQHLLDDARAYQRLALALHAAAGTAPNNIPVEIRNQLAGHWRAFRQTLELLFREFDIDVVIQVQWFNEKAQPLSGWPELRHEADWPPIQRKLMRLEEIRKQYPELREKVRHELRRFTHAIDLDLGLNLR